jgi:Domain of unknown function (DUF4365)
VDARVLVQAELDPRSLYTNFALDVQLKATSQKPTLKELRYSFFLQDVKRYDILRARSGPMPKILVVLFLPEDAGKWLEQSESSLIARRCAYWTSLWDAPPSGNDTGQTVYLPKANGLTVEGLTAVARRLSLEEELTYGS